MLDAVRFGRLPYDFVSGKDSVLGYGPSINNCNIIFNFVLRSTVMLHFVPSHGFWRIQNYILNFSYLLMGLYAA